MGHNELERRLAVRIKTKKTMNGVKPRMILMIVLRHE
jgi:hypothetical protein